MWPLERDSHVIPILLLSNRRELIAIFEIPALAAAVARREPVDIATNSLGHRAVHNDPDVLAGFTAAKIELVTCSQVDAAIEAARLVLAQIRLLVAQLRRALRTVLGEQKIEFELEVL